MRVLLLCGVAMLGLFCVSFAQERQAEKKPVEVPPEVKFDEIKAERVTGQPGLDKKAVKYADIKDKLAGDWPHGYVFRTGTLSIYMETGKAHYAWDWYGKVKPVWHERGLAWDGTDSTGNYIRYIEPENGERVWFVSIRPSPSGQHVIWLLPAKNAALVQYFADHYKSK